MPVAASHNPIAWVIAEWNAPSSAALIVPAPAPATAALR